MSAVRARTAVLPHRLLIAFALSFLVLCLHAAEPGHSADVGLVAAYAFDEGTGLTTADGSGNGLTGTINGATWTSAGKYGNALLFNGTSSYVDLGNPTALKLTGSMTWSAWVYATANPPDDGQIVAKSTNGGGSGGWQFKTSPDTGPHTFGVGVSTDGTTNAQRYSTTTRQLNTWYFVAGVYDAANRKLDIYVNGQLDDGVLRGTIPASQFDSNTNVNIGRRSGGFFFQGTIDEVRIYNRALSASEIQNVMVTPITPAGPPDPTPPTAPGTPLAAPMSATRIDTSWDPASDNVAVTSYRIERCQGSGCTNFAQIAAPSSTSYTDTNVTASTTYRYRVRAADAAGNLGAYSPISTATTVSGASAFSNDVAVQNLNFVPAMLFLPGGKMLMAEIGGTLRVVQAGATQPDSAAFLAIPSAVATADAGTHDLVLDPNFATNHYLYVFYEHGTTSNYRDTVSRFTVAADNNTASAASELVLWQDDNPTTTGSHHGASLAFGPDGKLYISTGDNGQPTDAQSLSSYHGKILRINSDGTIPSDNPFVDGSGKNKDEIWAYGMRNPYRMTFQPGSGRLYVGDVGGNTPSTSVEEIDLIVKGANYGWPLCDGGPCGAAGTTSPVYWYPHSGRDAAIMGGFFYTGSQYPAAFQGSYFFADYAQNWLKRITFDPTGTIVTGVFNFLPLDGSLDSTAIGDPVQLRQGPDGALYYLDLSFDEQAGSFNAGTLRRVSFLGSANQAPQVAVSASPTQGLAPLQVAFSSAGTVDAEGDPLTYAWDFGDGGTSTSPNPTHTYTANGQFQATLTVSDGQQTNFKSIVIRVGNPPTPTILAPSSGTLFRAGDHIAISGDGTDTEDGTLPDSAFSWTVIFHHDSHVHPGVGPINGVRNFTFDIPTSGHDFQGNTSYEIVLKVTDSSGLQTATSVFIYPDKVNVSFDTVPSGLNVELDGITRKTPFVYDALKGFHDTVNAPAQTSGVTAYAFTSWSDGGAQSHEYVVPNADASLVASYHQVAAAPPVAAYGFNEGSGTTAADSSGNGLTGTVNNATWTTAGKFGNALSFNGGTSYVDLGNPTQLKITGSMTWSAWIYATANPADDGQIVAKSGGSSGSQGWQFKTSPDTGPHTFGIAVSGDGNTNVQRYSNTVRSLNTWYFVAGVYDAPAQKLDIYVNGQLDDGVLSGTVPSSQFDPATNVNIGRRSGGFYFQGMIDEVRIYNRALNAAEIQSDMNSAVTSGPDTQPPTTPAGLTATAAGTTQINLSWQASTDNAGVTGYQVERCQSAGCTNFAQIATPTGTTLNDTGLTAGTSYSYRVRAVDAAGNQSGYSTVATATTATPDTQPPTAPATLSATAVSGSQINLSWSGATDNVAVTGYRVERCQGPNCTFTQIASPTGTTYSDTGLTPGTGYSYRVRATDAAGNLGPYSPIAGATTPAPDTQPPTAPATTVATAMSSTRIDVSWSAATDNVAVTGYRLERCQGALCTSFAQIAAPTATSYSDTGLAPSTSYSYRVLAVDGAGNLGPYSPTATATTQFGPTGLAAAYGFAEGTGNTTADASGNNLTGTLNGTTWTTAGKFGNALSFNGTSSYVDVGNPTPLKLTGSMTWSAWVFATADPVDDGQIVAKSGGTNGTQGWQFKTSPDTGPHTFAVEVSADGTATAQRYSTTVRQLNTWYFVAGVYDAAGRKLDIYVNGQLDDGVLRGTIPASQFDANTNVNVGRRSGGFNFAGRIDELRIYNRALTASEIQADMNSAVTSAPDTQPPTAPASLTATAAGASQINLSWPAATDNVGVTGYRVERCQGASCTTFAQIAAPTTTTYSDTGLTASTSYSYRVRAVDAAGNAGAFSPTASATTATPDTTPPTAPASLTATAASSAQINLSWSAATDNVGVTGYRVERCQGTLCTAFAQIAAPTTTSYSDTGLAPNTSYSYRVLAVDAAANAGPYSPVASATTPFAPSGLVAAYSFNAGSGTTLADSSGNGLNGTIVGATWTTAGKFGNALSFNGTSNYVDLGNPTQLKITGSMTWSAWVYATATPPDDGQIVAKSGSGNGTAGWQLKTSPDTGPHTFGVGVSGNGSSNAQRYSTTVRQLNTWYFVTGVYDAAAQKLDIYVNGQLDDGVLRGTIPAAQADPNTNVNIGRRSGGFYFAGRIDELRIYNRALSASEIQALMNTPV